MTPPDFRRTSTQSGGNRPALRLRRRNVQGRALTRSRVSVRVRPAPLRAGPSPSRSTTVHVNPPVQAKVPTVPQPVHSSLDAAFLDHLAESLGHAIPDSG